jgi:hypothetical protein
MKRPARATTATPAAQCEPTAKRKEIDDGQRREEDQKPARCHACRKRVGLTGFSCRCGNVYCGQHRHAEGHGCTFDYKAEHVEKLSKENPVVRASKVPRV